MIGKSFIYNGNTIPYTGTEARANNWLADIDWTDLSVDNSSLNRQDFHGVISNPTFARGRLMTVSGQVFAVTKATRGTAQRAIEDIFILQDFPTQANEFKVLQFKDDDDSDWFINAKVFSTPSFTNPRGESVTTFTCELFAQDPIIRSLTQNSVSGNYALLGGVTLPTTLPIALDGVLGSFSGTNTGNFASPCVVTITGDIVNPRIYNLTTGRYFGYTGTLTASGGDSLVIDTEANTMELNGVNVLANRYTGSNWIFAQSGANNFVLIGDDFDVDNQTKASVTVAFYNTRI